MASDYEVTHLAKHNPDGKYIRPEKLKQEIEYCEKKCGRDQCVFKCHYPTVKTLKNFRKKSNLNQ